MYTQESNKSGFKIFFIILGLSVLFLAVSLYLFLIPWAKAKVISYVEESTDYKLNINSIAFTGFHSLSITGVELRPKLDVKDFYREDPFERDWISVKADQLLLEGIDWKSVFWDKKSLIDSIKITDAQVYVLRDKRIQDGPAKFKPLPGSILRNANFSFTAPLIKLIKGKITYDEIGEDGAPIHAVFSGVYGSLYNLSSDTTYIAQHPEVILDGIGLIMDTIKAKMQYKFYPLDKNDYYSYEGHVGRSSATIFNRCIKPLMVGFEIKSGEIDRLSFFFKGNNDYANGTADIEYKNLKINVLSRKYPGKTSIIKTLVGNIIINNDHTHKDGEKHDVGHIDCQRDANRFIFNYWWKSIRSGLVSTIIRTPLPKKNNKNSAN